MHNLWQTPNPSQYDRSIGVHQSALTRKARQSRPIPNPFEDKSCGPAGRKVPPAQDSKRMNDHINAGRCKAVGKRPGRGKHHPRRPTAPLQPTRKRKQLQVRAIETGRRMQKQDPARNGSRRGA
jgi:hypothetical protein